MNKLVKKLLAGMILKKHTVIILLCVCAMFFTASGCRQNSDELKGTSWKFAGIIDTLTGELEELEPKDCEECYTLTFVTNTKAEWYGLFFDDIVLKHELDLHLIGKYEIEDIGRPKGLDKFIRSLYAHNTKSYSVNSKELKFINNVDNYYLLFINVDEH